MAATSAEFLDVEDEKRQRSLHRSRSGGYADHIEEKTNWDRHKKEMQMRRYHESRYGGFGTTPQQRSTADRLTVPVFETNTKRNRSSSDVSRRQIPSSSKYNVQEVRPSHDYDLTSQAPLPSQLPVRREWKPPSQTSPPPPSQSPHQRKPSIKVEIHQDKKPVPQLTMSTPTSVVKTRTPAQTPRRSPNASPRSPSAQPQLLYQYSTLQNKLSQITKVCGPYLKVEAANPRDLTFEKIAEQIKGIAFELHVWSHTVRLESMEMIDSRKRKIVEASSRNLDRMLDRVTELNEVCSDAKPRDLKLAEPPRIDDEDLFKDDEDDDGFEFDVTESPAFIIYSCLDSIELHMGNLKRLTRSLQEANIEAKEEVMAVENLVDEVAQYFGSEEALRRYGIDDRFSGGKALDEARYTAAREDR